MQEKTPKVEEPKKKEWPETGKQGGQGQGDIGRKGGDLGDDLGKKREAETEVKP